MNALYRPGPMDYIPSFVARKRGEEPITYDLPAMEEFLKETYGVTVYQEQVMLISQKVAGFSKGKADKLRKAMGKKKIDILQSLYGEFIEGGTKNGHPEEVLKKIWKDWEKFASYAFNKSHASYPSPESRRERERVELHRKQERGHPFRNGRNEGVRSQYRGRHRAGA